jgi:transposase
MEHVGIDVHKRESQVEILTEQGEVIVQRVRTERQRLGEVFGKRPPAKILIEASTESEWVARCLEELGHEVIVADPNFAPMYLERTRQVKTDRRDAHALRVACELGVYRPAHRTSEDRRRLRAQLAVREGLVRARARCISLVELLLRREGCRVGSGSAEGFLGRVDAMTLSGPLKSEIGPVLATLVTLNQQIRFCDRLLERLVERDEQVQLHAAV